MLRQVQTKHFYAQILHQCILSSLQGSANKWNTAPMIDNRHFFVKILILKKAKVELFKLSF
jgi:hypothetical protein